MDWSEVEISLLVERLNLISRLTGGEVSDAIVKSIDLITSLRLEISKSASVSLNVDAGLCAVEDIMMRNQNLAFENDLLRAERDEARRMYCKAVADHYEYACNAELDGAGPYTQKDVAKDEGWDCFKEDGK